MSERWCLSGKNEITSKMTAKNHRKKEPQKKPKKKKPKTPTKPNLEQIYAVVFASRIGAILNLLEPLLRSLAHAHKLLQWFEGHLLRGESGRASEKRRGRGKGGEGGG